MSYKEYIPKTKEAWDDYWQQKSIEADLALCAGDELLPLFKHYLSRDMAIIEAGSGLGKWVITLTREGYTITGIDTYLPGLSRAHHFEPRTNYLGGTVTSLPCKTESIDAYLSLGVIEHFEAGPHQALAEAYRVLKPGGMAIIEVPADHPLRQLLRLKANLIQAIKLPLKKMAYALKLKQSRPQPMMQFYEYHYTRNELASFVKQCGLRLETIKAKDDSRPNYSIGLWLDYPRLRHPDGTLFKLTQTGVMMKKLLGIVNKDWYSALIVAIARKTI